MTKNSSHCPCAEFGSSTLLCQFGVDAIVSWPRAACSILVMSVALTGCGNGLSSVSGDLTLDDQPLAGSDRVRATIMFYPESGGAPAAALADESGGYVLSTGAQDGLAPGNYLVIVSATESSPPAVAGGTPSKRVLTPEKYANPKQSGLRAEVKPGRNTFNFDLKSDAKS